MSFLRSTILTRPCCVHDADVAGAEEAVRGHHLGGLVRPLPVAGHHLRPARADFAVLAERHLVVVVVADRNVGRRQRQADGAGPFGDVAAIAGEHRRSFRQAVALDDRLAGRLQPGVGDRLLHRHAAGDRGLEHAPVELAEIGMIEQRVVERVHRREHSSLCIWISSLIRPAMSRGFGIRMQMRAAADAEQEARGQREDVIERQRGDDDHAVDRAAARASIGAFQASTCNTLATRLRCSSIAPLATPVVPPVYCRKAMSSGPTATRRERQRAAGGDRVVELGRAAAARRPAPSS